MAKKKSSKKKASSSSKKSTVKKKPVPKAKKTSKSKAELEAKKKAELEAKKKAELEAKKKADLEAKKKAELEAKKKAELEAKKKADLEAKKKAELEAKKKAELEAKKKAELEAKKKAELEAKKKAELEAKKKAELEAKKKAELEAKEKAELEAKEKAELEAKEKAELEAKEKAEDEAVASKQNEKNKGVVKMGQYKEKEEKQEYTTNVIVNSEDITTEFLTDWKWHVTIPFHDINEEVTLLETKGDRSNEYIIQSLKMHAFSGYNKIGYFPEDTHAILWNEKENLFSLILTKDYEIIDKNYDINKCHIFMDEENMNEFIKSQKTKKKIVHKSERTLGLREKEAYDLADYIKTLPNIMYGRNDLDLTDDERFAIKILITKLRPKILGLYHLID
ncbi:hypothetical protein [Candidatus Lokiarchaeum ossiferum]|uniref:hypothetical protein n=1 Tax=Candidatus Lokiarchaeum ossiferum TaxID=2951803 RepID=UPI00352F12BF